MRIRSFNTIYSKRFGWMIGICVLFIMLAPALVEGSNLGELLEEEPRILVVYSTEGGEIDEEVRLLDVLLGHFSTAIVFRDDQSLSSSDLENITHLVYYGKVKSELAPATKQLIARYQGPLLALGHNVEQLGDRFSFLTVREKVAIHGISKPLSAKQQLLSGIYYIPQLSLDEGEVLLQGWKGERGFPLYVKKGDTYYFATEKVFEPFLYFIGEGLFQFFQKEHSFEHPAYIRLEDVHPLSDPVLLRETGDYLVERGIPFMIALIPIYTNPDTLQQYHLKESPELVEVLKHLQDSGASILLHGYTHQYRQSETGEGFEFWDVENNTPIIGPPDQDVRLKKWTDFSTMAEYDSYVEQIKEFEEHYIRSRIEKGIQEVAELGLFPLGFEPPHYTMSQAGYGIVAEYFNIFAGQVQLGDRDWQIMSSAPYIAKPSFFKGMTLLPETVGYYDPESATPYEEFTRNVDRMREVEGSVIGMFFHPYLGVEPLKKMITYVESIPNLSWIDLKAMDVKVTSPALSVSRSGETLHVQHHVLQRTLLERVQELLKNWGLQAVLWGIAVLVAVMVSLFVAYTVYIRMGLRQQLFEEKKVDG